MSALHLYSLAHSENCIFLELRAFTPGGPNLVKLA